MVGQDGFMGGLKMAKNKWKNKPHMNECNLEKFFLLKI